MASKLIRLVLQRLVPAQAVITHSLQAVKCSKMKVMPVVFLVEQLVLLALVFMDSSLSTNQSINQSEED